MSGLVYSIALICFGLAFSFLKILPACREVFELALQSIASMTDPLLEDDQKQSQLQRLFFTVLKHFVLLTLRVFLLISATLLPFLFFDYFRLIALEQSLAFASRIDVLLLSSALLVFVLFLYRKTSRSGKDEKQQQYSDSYSSMERLVHYLAFGVPFLARLLNRIESYFFAKQWQDLAVPQPVFITSLPRAGTTILLEVLYAFPGTASHTYRDMPFLFSPVLWQRLSSRFRKTAIKKERAHADGILVDEDSPEAFEEVLWKRFYPQKYDQAKIYLWHRQDEVFRDFFVDHIKRIVFLRAREKRHDASTMRYLSKNNANIARIPVLKAMFPQASILVPVRQPGDHALSLLRQHRRFGEKHAQDDFSKRYMADIGHFEFGELHRRIDFPDPDHLLGGLLPDQADYWLAYWITCYESLLKSDGLIFISHDDLCQDSEASLRRLCQRIGLVCDAPLLEQQGQRLHAVAKASDDSLFSPHLLDRAEFLYRQVLEKKL